MVTATIAEVTRHGVNIKGPDGRTIAARSARLADPSYDAHGINLDEGDEIVTQLGYLAGTWRWNGDHWKAVVLPEKQAVARRPGKPAAAMTYDDYRKTFGAPETYARMFPGKVPEDARYRAEVERARGKR